MTTRRFLGGGLLAATMGCATVRPVQQPHEFFANESPDIVLVKYHDNSEVPVEQPSLRGDTLIGTWSGLNEPVAVPLTDIRQIDARQRDRTRTAFLVAGAAVFTAGGIIVATKVWGNGVNCDHSYTPGTLAGARCLNGEYANP